MTPRSLADRLVILAIVALLATSGCGAFASTGGPTSDGQPPGVSPPEASPLARAAATIGPAPIASATTASDPAGSSPAAGSSGSPGVRVDPLLLAVLPAEVDGVPLLPDPATAGQIASDVSLSGFAEAIAVALAVSPGSSSGDDLAIATVLRIRPGVFSDSWFGTYRDSYDAAACGVAGGVQGQPSVLQIGGRTAYVGTCAGDAHTYHVHLADPTVIVSITAGGARGFGELVVAGLAE